MNLKIHKRHIHKYVVDLIDIKKYLKFWNFLGRETNWEYFIKKYMIL